MILLFEGLDKVGKSTLIRNFRALSKMPVFKNQIKPDGTIYSRGFVNGLYLGAYEAAKLADNDIIFDRSHITEIAYSEVKRGYLPNERLWLKWEKENRHFTIAIYIDAPITLIAKRFRAEKEEYVKISEIKRISAKYEQYFTKSTVRFIYIDGSLTKERMLDQLMIQLKNLGYWSSVRNR